MIQRPAASSAGAGSLSARAKSLPSASLSQRATAPANLGCISSRTSSYSGDEADPARSFSRAASLTDLLKDKLGAPTLPRSPDEFLRPLLHGSKTIRGSASSYLAMLCESSTSKEHFQQHILRMFARGMVDTAKVARVIQDPGSGLSDICIDTGCSMWLKHLKSQEESAPDSSDNPISLTSSIGSSTSSSTGGGGGGGWKRLRLRVLGASCFKKAVTKDDNYLPDRSSEVSPLHAKALSLMLSVMLSASSSCLSECLSHSNSSTSTEPGLTPTVISNTTQAAVNTGKALLSGMLQAPCLTSHGSSGFASHGSGLASHNSSSLASQISGQVSQIGGLASHASGLASHASALASHNSSGGKVAQLAGAAAGKLSSFGSGPAAAVVQSSIAEAGQGVLGFGGAAAANVMKAIRSDSKKLGDVLGSWASVSMDAAGSVLELFVESVEKVDKESRTLCGNSFNRSNSLPHCLQPLVDKCGDSVKESSIQSIKSCRQ